MGPEKKPNFNWPDLVFPPINLWCLMSAYDFYELMEMKQENKPKSLEYLHGPL